jgi:hypothetical protein
MRAYLIDEIQPEHMQRIKDFLENNTLQSNLDKIAWVKIPDDILSEIQLEHRNCQPHVFAVERGLDWVKLEFFVRTLTNMGCKCIGYCTPPQMNYVIKFAHRMIEQAGIKT